MTMTAILTDDADRMPFGCDSFDTCPVGDRDIMSDEHDFACGSPKCANRDGIPCCCDYEGRFVGPGCRHCNPVDFEAKPYGWQIERFESRLVDRLRRELFATAVVTGLTFDQIRTAAVAWSGFSRRREKHSDIVWERLCCECQTHTEAVEKYTAWARRAVTVRYRDEV